MRAATWFAAAALVVGAAAQAAGPRVLVQLQAQPARERALLDFTQRAMAEIRQVPGLLRVEVNLVEGEPGRLVLYYTWRSREDEKAYLASELFKRVSAGLEPLVAERRLTRLDNVD